MGGIEVFSRNALQAFHDPSVSLRLTSDALRVERRSLHDIQRMAAGRAGQ